MAAVCPTPTPSRKRGYYEADERYAPSAESACQSASKRLRVDAEAAVGAALCRLRCLFPMVDDATVRRVLDACAHDVDAAIAQLSALQLAQETRDRHAPPPPPPPAAPAADSAGSPAAAAAASCKTADDWIGAFVDEMAKSTDVADARDRAARALRAFEAFVLARAAPAAGGDAAAARDVVARLERENAVLKKAVAIQNARLKANETDLARLAKKSEAQAEKLRQLETTNYSLSCHLRHASPGGLGDLNFRPPDVC